MRQQTFGFFCFCSAAAILLVTAVPLPAGNQELDVLQIPLSNGKELDVLTLGSQDQEQMIAERNKRTIGLLRELFPDITKEIDGIVNRIIAQVIRVAGPSLLPAILNSNRPTTERSNLNSNDDDDDDDFDSDNSNDNDISTNNVGGASFGGGDSSTRVKVDLPTFAPDSNADSDDIDDDDINDSNDDVQKKNK